MKYWVHHRTVPVGVHPCSAPQRAVGAAGHHPMTAHHTHAATGPAGEGRTAAGVGTREREGHMENE